MQTAKIRVDKEHLLTVEGMDPALKEAARNGDVKFLKKAFPLHPSDYILSQAEAEDETAIGGNIFHLAAWNDQAEFVREAMKILPLDIQKRLLLQVESNFKWNPLHVAAVKQSDVIVKVIKEMYASLSCQQDDQGVVVKPWLAVSREKMTPLHLALKDERAREKCAMEILSMDSDYVSCTMFDGYGNTPLVYALKNRFNFVAEKILMSPLSRTSIFRSTQVSSPFTYASRCSENVVRFLFKTCGEWMDKVDSKGYSVLHQWAESGEAGPCKLLLLEGDDVGDARAKIFKECIFEKEKSALDTPLHLAARKKDSELGQILIRGYQQQMSVLEGELEELVATECPPWKVKNTFGNTALHSALYATSKHEDLALDILSIDPTMCEILNNKGESPFFLAVKSGCSRVVDEIMRITEPRFNVICRNDGTTVLHCLSSCPEDIGKRLLEKYWWIMISADDEGKTAVDYAKEANADWLVSLLTDPSSIEKEEFDWIEACRREETGAVHAFAHNCEDLKKMCGEKDDTPLHPIKLSTYKEHRDFLKIPAIAELKNMTDHDGRTPLHRALERKNMLLVRTLLLDDEVNRTIADCNGRTPMNLLAKLYEENEDWEKMCRLVKVNPYLESSSFELGNNLDQVRNTLLIIAALLSTITFTAGFTLPGGIDSNTGNALLAKKGVFLVFLLSDAYAMCASMLILFTLTWSMAATPQRAWSLVKFSLILMAQCLYGTMIAFMTGIYTVMAHASLWAAVLIIVMCSITVILVISVSMSATFNKMLAKAARATPQLQQNKIFRSAVAKERMENINWEDEEERIE